MSRFFFLLKETLEISEVNLLFDQEISLFGRRFSRHIHPDEPLLFFDAIVDQTCTLKALQVNCCLDSFFKDLLSTGTDIHLPSYVLFSPFLQVWHKQSPEGKELGLEAFGDIAFYRSSDNLAAIAVDFGNWLQNSACKSIFLS